MGFFGDFLYANGRWSELDPDAAPPTTPDGPWMSLSIHDSDLTTVQYAPHDGATGTAYLGTTPRTYFDDPSASEPTDPAREAAGLVTWAKAVTGQDVQAAALQRYLVGDDDELSLDGDLDDADIFVEVKTAQFVAALGLPVPESLPDVEDHEH